MSKDAHCRPALCPHKVPVPAVLWLVTPPPAVPTPVLGVWTPSLVAVHMHPFAHPPPMAHRVHLSVPSSLLFTQHALPVSDYALHCQRGHTHTWRCSRPGHTHTRAAGGPCVCRHLSRPHAFPSETLKVMSPCRQLPQTAARVTSHGHCCPQTFVAPNLEKNSLSLTRVRSARRKYMDHSPDLTLKLRVLKLATQKTIVKY